MKKLLLLSLAVGLCAAGFTADTPAAPAKAPDPTADFKTFASGEKAIYWCQIAGEKDSLPRGKVTITDGKVTITGIGAKKTGVRFFRSHKLPKLQIEPGDVVKISVTATGSGKLFFGLSGYMASGRPYYTYTKDFELGSEPKVIRHEFRLNKVCVKILPLIYVTGDDKATISDFKLEIQSAEL